MGEKIKIVEKKKKEGGGYIQGRGVRVRNIHGRGGNGLGIGWVLGLD